MSYDLISLGASCDLVAEDETERTLSFQVEEYALLAGGRRITLLDDRGWSSTFSGGDGSETHWDHLTAVSIERDVLNVVLPDDAEETGETHEWQWFVERLRDAGVEATVDDLMGLPYSVVLSPRLRARLQSS